MAVMHVVIHKCDLCGDEVKPSHITKVTVGLDKHDACTFCTSEVRRCLSVIKVQRKRAEQE